MNILRFIASMLVFLDVSALAQVPVPIHAIIPKYVVPGGTTRVLIGGECSDFKQFSALIGSRSISVIGCESAQNTSFRPANWLVLKMPDISAPPNKALAEGWQVLSLSSSRGSFSQPVKSSSHDYRNRNIQIIPYTPNLLLWPISTLKTTNAYNIIESWLSKQNLLSASSRNSILNTAKLLIGLNFVSKRYPYENGSGVSNSSWMSVEGAEEDSILRKLWPTTPPQAKSLNLSALNTNNYIASKSGICNSKVLYQLDRTLELNQLQAAGLLIEAANAILSDGKIDVIGPATLGQPSETHIQNTYRDPWERTWTSLKSTGVFHDPFQRSTNLTGKGSIIYLIDTLSGRKDSFGTREVDIGKEVFTMDGHGKGIFILLKDKDFGISSGAGIINHSACGSEGCAADQVIAGICLAAKEASKSKDRKVIINLSLETSYDHPLLRHAIEDALSTGAAVVTGFGNADPCNGRNLDGRDFCNAYPADWVSDKLRGFYSVGAVDADNQVPRDFQRGYKRSQTAPQTFTRPLVTAPGQFWLPANPSLSGLKKVQNYSLSPYVGTSFSAPVLTGLLAIWSEKCGKKSNQSWPNLYGKEKIELSDFPTC